MRSQELAGTRTHLQPLGLVVALGCPGVGFAGLVQASVMRVPGKGIDAPGLEDAGGCDLLVGDEVGFHAQRLRATCRVEIHCNTTVYTGSEKDRDNSTASKTPQICQKPSPYSHCTAHQGRAGKRSTDMQGCLLPGFLAPSYSLAHSASCCRDEWMSPQHSPALEYRKLWQEAEKDVERAAQRYPQPEARMAPHPRSSRKDPNPSIPLPQRVPLSSQERAAGQECSRDRERAQAEDPLRFPEDFDPLLLFKLSGRKSSGFTAQKRRGHSKNCRLRKVLAA